MISDKKIHTQGEDQYNQDIRFRNNELIQPVQ